eukprot:scaffold3737_cov83-Alexandrium_tamarense.AAC.1
MRRWRRCSASSCVEEGGFVKALAFVVGGEDNGTPGPALAWLVSEGVTGEKGVNNLKEHT